MHYFQFKVINHIYEYQSLYADISYKLFFESKMHYFWFKVIDPLWQSGSYAGMSKRSYSNLVWPVFEYTANWH